MNKRIAPILAILAWLYGGRLAGADELPVTRRATGLGDMTYRVDEAFDWRQPWHASEASQMGASWGATYQHWAQGHDYRGAYSLSQSPAYAYAFSSFRYVSYVEGGAGSELVSKSNICAQQLGGSVTCDDQNAPVAKLEDGQETTMQATYYSTSGIGTPNGGMKSDTFDYRLSL